MLELTVLARLILLRTMLEIGPSHPTTELLVARPRASFSTLTSRILALYRGAILGALNECSLMERSARSPMFRRTHLQYFPANSSRSMGLSRALSTNLSWMAVSLW